MNTKPFPPSLTGFTDDPRVWRRTRRPKRSRHTRSSGPPPIDRDDRTGCAHRSTSGYALELGACGAAHPPQVASLTSKEVLLAGIGDDVRRCRDVKPLLGEQRLYIVCTCVKWLCAVWPRAHTGSVAVTSPLQTSTRGAFLRCSRPWGPSTTSNRRVPGTCMLRIYPYPVRGGAGPASGPLQGRQGRVASTSTALSAPVRIPSGRG